MMKRGMRVGLAAWAALTLGIALNTTMFSTIEGFLLRPLPIDDIGSMVRVRELARGDGEEQEFSMSPSSFVAWREHNRVFEGMAAGTGQALTLAGDGDPQRLAAGRVTANFFDVLGMRAALGRTFVAGEDGSGANHVALLGDELWRTRFGADPEVIGGTLTLDGQVHTVVGVMPRGFSHPYDAELWVPFDLDALVSQPSGNFLYVPARLRAGITLATAQEELDRLAAALASESAQPTRTNASRLTPLRDELLGSLRPVLLVLLGGSLLVLLLAVVNVANLLLARSVSERQETALRVALGARGGHLFRRALRRNGTVAVGAWLAGLALCVFTLEPMLGLAGVSSMTEFDAAPRVNWATAGYALLLAVAIALTLALVERRAAHVRGAVHIGREKGASLSIRTRRLLGGLIVAQFALSFALAGATLLVATGYSNLVAGERGYHADGLTVASVAFPRDRYPDAAARVAAVEQMLSELRASPGVFAVGASTVTPDFAGTWAAGFTVAGHAPPSVPGYELTHHRVASAGYLDALGVPLLTGRDFDEANPARVAGAVFVSRHVAERLWGSPVAAEGRALTGVARAGPVELTVVGVAGEVVEAEQASAADFAQTWYLPLTAGTDYDASAISLVVRAEPAVAAASLRAVVGRLDPQLALHRLMPMSNRLADTYSRERWSRFMFGLFGASACLITFIGLYSALGFLAALQRREFGVRMALGARSGAVAAGIVRQALTVAMAGVAVGLPLLWAAQRVLQASFPALAAGDAGGMAWLVLGLCAVAALAALPPAIGAARIDPAQALLEE